MLWALALAALLLAVDRVARAALAAPRAARARADGADHAADPRGAARLRASSSTLFHLVALILAAGLGLDYALFFDHAGDDRAEQLRTLHAVIVCSLTTLLVFALLALSSIPVLRAIGSTVALGVVCNFVLALLIARHPAHRSSGMRRDASIACRS